MFKHVFSFDPGDKNNGFCYFKYDTETKIADLKVMKILTTSELENMLKVVWGIGQSAVETELFFVCENFRVDTQVREVKFQWNEMLTSRNIGKIEMCAKWTGGTFVTQEPAQVLPMARKWGPWPTLPKHPPDDKSAWLHGAHYMMNRAWFPTIDSITWYGQEKM